MLRCKVPVAFVFQQRNPARNTDPVGGVVWFDNVAQPPRGAAQIDVTSLARPEPVIWHKGIPQIGAQASLNLYAPAGFLKHLAVQGRHR